MWSPKLQVRVERREGLVVIGNRAGDPRELLAEEETSLVARQRPRARCCHDGEAIECSFLPPYPPFSRARYPANPEGACSKVREHAHALHVACGERVGSRVKGRLGVSAGSSTIFHARAEATTAPNTHARASAKETIHTYAPTPPVHTLALGQKEPRDTLHHPIPSRPMHAQPTRSCTPRAFTLRVCDLFFFCPLAPRFAEGADGRRRRPVVISFVGKDRPSGSSTLPSGYGRQFRSPLEPWIATRRSRS